MAERYYFDYAAATPVDPRVERAMRPYWSKLYGNPGSLHWFGQEASAAVFESRSRIAKALGCRYRELVFTGSATEANNLALRGILKSIRYAAAGIRKPKIITSAFEHESVLETCRDLEKEGAEVIYLPVSKEGIVDLKELKNSLDDRTVLVSVMQVNNEVGTIQPILEISRIISEFKGQKSGKENPGFPLFHTDAAQAFNYCDCRPENLGADLMTLSAQKIYGPKGVGLLYIKSGDQKFQSASRFNLRAILTGGGQENGLRGGTENVPGIVGFGKAVELAEGLRLGENKRLRDLQRSFWQRTKKALPKVLLNGSFSERIPNNLNLYFPGRSAQDLIIQLDLAGFAVSSGAACSARACQPSHVLSAMGFPAERASGSLRITFGRPTSGKEIKKLFSALKKIIKK